MSDRPQEDAPQTWRDDPEQLAHFVERVRSQPFSRRRMLALMGGLAGSALLAACGEATTSTPVPAAATPTANATVGLATVGTGGGAATAGTTQTAATDLADTQTLTIAQADEPASHDFNKDLYCNGEAMLFAALLRLTPDFAVEPYAAESYDVKDGGATYVFHLSPKGTWTNGEAVTAADFIYSFTRQLDPATAAPYAGFLYDIKNAQSFNTKKGAAAADLGLKALDTFTLQITLEGSRAYFPVLIAYPSALPAYKPAVEKFGDKWTEPGNIVSNGPFKLTSWDHNKQFVVERNEAFAIAAKPKLQKVIVKIVPDQAGVAPYENNELDYRAFSGIPAVEVPRLKADATLGKELVTYSQSGLWYLEPVANKPPFDNKAVRQALLHAIDRDQLVKLINGLGIPAYTLISPDLPGYIDPATYPELTGLAKYDPTAALAALKGTPFEGGKNWPKVTLTLRQEGATATTVAQFVQKQLKDNVGLDVQLEVLEQRVFRDKLYANQLQFVFIRWYMDYPDPNNFYYQVWYSKFASGRRHWYNNDVYDSLVTQAAGETDPTKRLSQYRDAEKILLSDAAYVPLYYPYAPALFKPYVKGIPKNKADEVVVDKSLFNQMKATLYIAKH